MIANVMTKMKTEAGMLVDGVIEGGGAFNFLNFVAKIV